MRRFVELAHHLLHLPVQCHDDQDGDNDDDDDPCPCPCPIMRKVISVTLPTMIISQQRQKTQQSRFDPCNSLYKEILLQQ